MSSSSKGSDDPGMVLGVDVGTECVKAVMLDDQRKIVARTSVPTQGYFETCVEEVTKATLEEAKCSFEELQEVVSTGFGASCVPKATRTVSTSRSHAAGAYLHHPQQMTVVDIGGREVRAISVGPAGELVGSRGGRKCVAGIGSFLMFAARHLDVHPTRMQELAAEADEPASVSSFCSVFSSNELLERLREGASREDVALGCMRAIAERILELGIDHSPVVITGGVPEYFPGVLTQIEALASIEVTVSPDPIYTAAHGAALTAFVAKEEVTP